jgi:hypothetical protein
MMLIARHDYARGKVLYQTAVSADPKVYRAWFHLATVGIALGNATETLADLDAFSKTSPAAAIAYRNDAIFAPFARCLELGMSFTSYDSGGAARSDLFYSRSTL